MQSSIASIESESIHEAMVGTDMFEHKCRAFSGYLYFGVIALAKTQVSNSIRMDVSCET